MDPSALIFVGLAVAWAVYLVPKALEHHDEGARTRTVERFSATIRVLARREPVSRRKARLVTSTASTTERTSSRRTPEPQLTPTQLRARRRAAAKAAKRRLRVLTLILVGNAVVAALGWFAVVDWVWCAVPVGVLAVWLVACRLMVKRERRDLPAGRIPVRAPAPAPGSPEAPEETPTSETPADPAAERDPDSWDPVEVPLPSYVTKAVAPRSVTTIDLDSTGVWSSGRNDADSQLAREAEAAERSAPEAAGRRASGA